ncbi:MAG: hypothetical protein ABIG61_13830 [Planctomycetota bacterium]
MDCCQRDYKGYKVTSTKEKALKIASILRQAQDKVDIGVKAE